MEWYLIFFTCFFGFPTALTIIVEGPKSSVYPEGRNVTLQCLAKRSNRIVWEDIIENTVIFIDKTKNTQKIKFDNFFISNSEDNFSLTIVNAQLSDEGFYSCKEGDEKRSASVTIEAGPDLSILVNNTARVPKSRITITEDEPVFVMCKADGAKPAVYLKLKFGDNEWIETNHTTTNNGLRFTTKTTGVVRHVTRNDTTVTCQATGQVSIPPSTTMISMNVLYKPICVIEVGTNLTECQCMANPAVTAYNWYINGELRSTNPSLQINEYIPANITCLASNEVGTSLLTSRYVPLTNLQSEPSTKYVAIIIAATFVCVIVILVLLIIVYKRSKHAKDTTIVQTAEEDVHLNAGSEDIFYDAGEALPRDADEENIHLRASTRRKATDETEAIFVDINDKNVSFEPKQEDEDVKIDPRLKQLISRISDVISHDWEIFAIEDLQLETETVKEIIRKYSEVSDQLSAALEHWVTFCPEASRSYLERNILPQSEVFYYIRARGGENNAALSTNKTVNAGFPQVVTFSELVKEVVKYVGHIGAQRLSRQYQELYLDTFETTLAGESIIKLLQEEKLLIDDMESLRRFKKALDDSLLLRASHLVDTYMNKNENMTEQPIACINIPEQISNELKE